MTFDERVRAVAARGYTDRQARFLVTVMLHSGVCMVRQYCTFCRIARGQNTQDFFAGLVDHNHADVYTDAHRRARIFHLRHRSLYEAVGEPHSRYRKPASIGAAIERLMLLDVVLADHELTWLATEREKVAHFRRLLGSRLGLDELPRLAFGVGPSQTVRYFPDKLPIGITSENGRHVFAYLVRRPSPIDFRAFLQRHAELLRALPEWSIRIVFPLHFQDARDAYLSAIRQELTTPLRPAVADELRWYFAQRDTRPDQVEVDHARLARARQAFGSPRFRALYRLWRTDGRRIVDATVSPVLADAMRRGTGQIESQVLTHPYLHLSTLVGTS